MGGAEASRGFVELTDTLPLPGLGNELDDDITSP